MMVRMLCSPVLFLYHRVLFFYSIPRSTTRMVRFFLLHNKYFQLRKINFMKGILHVSGVVRFFYSTHLKSSRVVPFSYSTVLNFYSAVLFSYSVYMQTSKRYGPERMPDCVRVRTCV